METDTEQEAERLCQHGKSAYERHQIECGEEEWVETAGVEN